MKNYLVNKILDKYEKSSTDWKDKQSGGRSITIQQDDYDELQKMLDRGTYEGYGTAETEFFDTEELFTGKECILKEAQWLLKCGLVTIRWFSVGNDIERISYSLQHILEFYKIAQRESKFALSCKKSEQLRKYQSKVQSEWIKQYYEERIAEAEKGKEKETAEMDEMLFRCLSAIEKLEFPMYIRTFSSQYLGHSKRFEETLKTKILSIAGKYHPQADEEMGEYQIYEQLFLDTYSQELALKGNLVILLDGKEIDLSMFTCGTVLNSETLKKAEAAQRQTIKKVISVENKANFVSMSYEEGTLILFSHGFFSPLEREFLKNLEKVLDDSVEYFHTGDLDYGGVRIFQYIRKKIFPKLQPYQMSVEQFKKYETQAIDIEPSKRKKLQTIQEPLLQDLIDLICEKEKVIEQESFL
uniref:Wadjet anti-phage system protein JetD domain-containing protein n=1 Tax=Agathobacter sp. TaxID=2021311 RepID=UPI004055A1A8